MLIEIIFTEPYDREISPKLREFLGNFYCFFINNVILAALISSIPLASAFGFSNGKHLLTELKKYGFEAERVADYGCYCQFLTDGGVNPPGMVI